MSRDPRLFLEDIVNSCTKINRYTEGMSLEEFVRDDRTWDAVMRNLEIIGEATKNIDDDTRQHMSGIEWRKVAGLRDILIHAYFGVDQDIVWDVIQNKIPELEQVVRKHLHEDQV